VKFCFKKVNVILRNLSLSGSARQCATITVRYHNRALP
jgi:hypothetical protein